MSAETATNAKLTQEERKLLLRLKMTEDQARSMQVQAEHATLLEFLQRKAHERDLEELESHVERIRASFHGRSGDELDNFLALLAHYSGRLKNL